MRIIFQSTLTEIGASAREGFEDDFFITFSETEATEDIREYCFLHTGGELLQDFSVGDTVSFAGKRFPITAFGNNASDNFRALGHVCMYFDGAEQAKLPGTVHLLGSLPADALIVGSPFVIETY